MISIETFRPILDIFVLIFQCIGAIFIIAGGIKAVVQLVYVWMGKKPKRNVPFDEEPYRIAFARSIIFGLEFLIAGDVLSTLRAPQLEQMYVLGLLVIIRTILSVFVAREVKQHEHLPVKKLRKRA